MLHNEMIDLTEAMAPPRQPFCLLRAWVLKVSHRPLWVDFKKFAAVVLAAGRWMDDI